MTPDEAKKRVAYIRDVMGDYEAAHAAEDDLRAEVLAAIASGSPHAAELARIALETEQMDFPRYCA